MLTDGRRVTEGTTLRAHVCIIGAGAAGITIARELRGQGYDIIVLESGGLEQDEATTQLNEGQIVGLPLDPEQPLPLDETRLRYFGGTTNHWAGVCRPFDPLDFEARPWVERSGWPITRESLDSYYTRAAPIVGIGRNEFDWQWWDQEFDAGAALVDDEEVRTLIEQITQRQRFGEVYRAELESADDVNVVLHANAVDIALASDGSHVARIECAVLDGPTFRVEADAYVLATGGIEVPRLLLASSRAIRPAGVGNEHDLVGRHFMEHLNVFAGSFTLTETLERTRLYDLHEYPAGLEAAPDAKAWLLGLFALTEVAQRREQLLSAEVTLAWGSMTFTDRVFAEQPHATLADVHTLAALSAEQRVGSGGIARVLAEQSPNPASRVMLTDERDALGMPRVALDWQLLPADRASIMRSLALIGHQLGRIGVGRVQLAAVSGDEVWIPASLEPEAFADADYAPHVGFHHMGTARMHDDPARGVVDAQCRVHSVPNLFVAGSSVFPTSGSSPPTFTIVALALRLADHLREKVLS